MLPGYLQFKVDELVDAEGKKMKETDNVKKIAHSGNGNTITTKPSARTKDAADKLGRGSTTPLHYYDEVEFTDWISEIVEAAGLKKPLIEVTLLEKSFNCWEVSSRQSASKFIGSI